MKKAVPGEGMDEQRLLLEQLWLASWCLVSLLFFSELVLKTVKRGEVRNRVV